MRPNRELFHSEVAPRKWRELSCEEYECDEQRAGFLAVLPLADDLTDQRADTIRRSSRRWAEFLVRQEKGAGWVVDEIKWSGVARGEIATGPVCAFVQRSGQPARVFAFPPGERCFTRHRVPAAAPALSVATGASSHRYNPNARYRPPALSGGTWREVERREWIGRFQDTTGEVNEIKRREGVDEMIKESTNG